MLIAMPLDPLHVAERTGAVQREHMIHSMQISTVNHRCFLFSNCFIHIRCVRCKNRFATTSGFNDLQN